jgi:hypothetical protein
MPRVANPLNLLDGWKDNPGAFARPGPAPAPPLPLKFTCNGCGKQVPPEVTKCPHCRELLYPRTK